MPETQKPFTTHTNVDTLDRVWRPATALTLVLGWIGLLAGGIEIPLAFQALTGTAVVGLGADRALFKRKNTPTE